MRLTKATLGDLIAQAKLRETAFRPFAADNAPPGLFNMSVVR